MKVLSAIAAALLLVTLGILGCAQFGRDAGWITLVDGTAKSFENFNRLGDANWRAEDGAIVADKGKGGHLVSKNSYKDFNSYEVNIYDQRPEPAYGTGAIVDFAKVDPMPKAGGRWNTFLITE
jgi:hypothetical protein